MRLKHFLSIFSIGCVLFSSCQMGSQQKPEIRGEIETFEGVPTPPTPPTPPAEGTSVKVPIKNVGPQANVDRLPTYQGGGRRVSSVNVSGKYVALTFDDGPHPTYTPKILDILKKYNAKATFFVLGSRVKSGAGIVARTIAEGNEVGNHSWDHPLLTKQSASGVKSQLDRTNSAIHAASPSYRVRVMRPPYGGVNTNLVNYFSHDYGMSTIMWSIDTNDWRKPGVQTVINRAVNQAKPGSIILMHDIHGSSYEAVEGVVSGLIARGFTLVTVSQLMAMQQAAPAPAPAAPVVVEGPAPEETGSDAALPSPVPAAEPSPAAPMPVSIAPTPVL